MLKNLIVQRVSCSLLRPARFIPLAFPRAFLFNPRSRFSVDTTAEQLESHYQKYLQTDIKSKVVSNPIINKQTSSTRKILKDVYLDSEDLTLAKLSKKFGVPLEKLEMSYIYVKDPRSKSPSPAGHIIMEEAKVLGYEYNFKVLPKELKAAHSNKKFPMRPPVVTIMGHVDHGKTTLLDALRNSSIAQNEFGGITQKIGAFHVHTNDGRQITFIDTPGHEVFINMRIRGASYTDLIILVVSAMDGVQQQTLEVIKIAQKTEVPMIVAINKIDIKGANPEEIETQLYEKGGLGIDVKGGNIPVIHISAKQRTNLDLLEELILYEAEQMDLRQDPAELAEGVVIEARKYEDDMNSCTVLIQKGTLKVGDFIVVGSELFKARNFKDDRGKPLPKAAPSSAVEIVGLKELPASGDVVFAVENESQGKLIAARRKFQELNSKPIEESLDGEHSLKLKFSNRRDKNKFYSGDKRFVREKYGEAEQELEQQMEDLKEKEKDLSVVGFQNISEEMEKIQRKIANNKKYVDEVLVQDAGPDPRVFKFMLKGPDQGTLETLRVQILKIARGFPDLQVNLLGCSVGAITENDVNCAIHFKCGIYSMDVPILSEAELLARKKSVKIQTSRLIFGVTDEIKKVLKEKSESILSCSGEQTVKGVAEIGNVFEIRVSRAEKKKIAGCLVSQGKLAKHHKFRILRKNRQIAEDLTLSTLKRFKAEVAEIKQGEECGLCFENFDDLQPGDLIQALDSPDYKERGKKSKSYK